MKKAILFSTAWLLFIHVSANFAVTSSFQGLGDLPGGGYYSNAVGVSADGTFVVGEATSDLGTQAFCWTQSGGMVNLSNLPGGNDFRSASDISDDGSTIVGRSVGTAGVAACVWKNGQISQLGNYSDGLDYAYGISADGSIITGYGYLLAPDSPYWEGYRWENEVITRLGSLTDTPPSNMLSYAYNISADGSTIVGVASSPTGGQAFKWTQADGMLGLGVLNMGDISKAQAVSEDGSVVVGSSYSSSGYSIFRWEDGVMLDLGELFGEEYPFFENTAYDVSGDGSLVVGVSNDTAFIWDEMNGIQDLQQLLTTVYGLDLTGWDLLSANAISTDGTTIVGIGINPSGDGEAWIAKIPEPATLSLLAFGGLALFRKRK